MQVMLSVSEDSYDAVSHLVACIQNSVELIAH